MNFDDTIPGWFCLREANVYRELAGRVIPPFAEGLIIEVGTHAGKSLMAIADLGRIICVDTWADNEIYELFIANLVKHNLLGKVTLLRMPSLDAARILSNAGVKADLIFIDASHDEQSVTLDIAAWTPIVRPGGIICGHDYHETWPGVIAAVHKTFGNRVGPIIDGQAIWYVTL